MTQLTLENGGKEYILAMRRKMEAAEIAVLDECMKKVVANELDPATECGICLAFAGNFGQQLAYCISVLDVMKKISPGHKLLVDQGMKRVHELMKEILEDKS